MDTELREKLNCLLSKLTGRQANQLSPNELDEVLDRLIGLPAAGRIIGRAPETVWRYVNNGTPTRHGARLRLQAVRVGSRWMTCLRWLTEFIDAQTSMYLGQPGNPRPAPRSPAAAARASDKASTELQRMGA